jgi:hypothetical protein
MAARPRSPARRAALALVWFEAVSNLFLLTPLMLAWPGWVLAQFLPEQRRVEVNSLSEEVFRWFGAMSLAFSGFGLLSALRSGSGEVERAFLRAHMVADVLYVGATGCWAVRTGVHGEPAVVGNVVYGAALFLCRIVRLHELAEQGQLEAAKRGR